MNVIIIAQYFPPDFGGASTRAYNIAKGLVLQKCDVTVISAFPHYPHGEIPKQYRWKILSDERVDGMRVIRTWMPGIAHSSVPKRIFLHACFIFSSLLGLFKVKNADIIIAMNPNLFSFFPAYIYHILFHKQIIRNVDDLWPEVFYDLGIIKSKYTKRILDFLASLSYHKPIAIIPVSNGYVTTLVEKYKIEPEKIVVVEHGVDTTLFHPIEDHQNTNDPNPQEDTILMYSGALALGYDFETILRAAKILESERVHFIIRGSGEMTDNIRNMIKQYQLRNVKLDTKLLPKQDLISFLNNADIFLLPMSSVGVIDQGLPTKIIEYQALGKPIVCISAGEAGRYITKTQSGLVTQERNPKVVAGIIMQLVNDKEYARQLGMNGLNNIKNNLTLTAVGKRIIDIIKQYK